MQKACAKFNALTKASGDMNPKKRTLIINAFISPQLFYSLLTGLFRTEN